MWGGEPVNDDGSPITEDAEQGFARGHYEQHVGARGVVRVGDEEWAVEGFGLRDHSWGPRFWQSPWWYRWLTANFGEDFGFVISIVTSRDGGQRIGGVVLEDGEYRSIDDVKRQTPDGDMLVTRISEGMTEWRCDGKVGYGLSEYLDQIVDGQPVGVTA
jgi:hypothetical protein